MYNALIFLFSACHKLAPVRYGNFLVSSLSANHGPDLISLSPPLDSRTDPMGTCWGMVPPFLFQIQYTLNDT